MEVSLKKVYAENENKSYGRGREIERQTETQMDLWMNGGIDRYRLHHIYYTSSKRSSLAARQEKD